MSGFLHTCSATLNGSYNTRIRTDPPAMLRALLLLMPAPLLAELLVGRLREGQYEYPRLNGWLSPGRAAARCERDPQCGGFTYKAISIIRLYKVDISNAWIVYQCFLTSR